MKMKAMPVAVALALLTFAACDKNDDDDNNAVNSTDRSFVTSAALSNTAEIEAAQVALTNGSDPAIKSFAQMMIIDHQKAQTDLKAIASSLGLYAPDSVDAVHAAEKAMLLTLTGRVLDSVYINGQVDDHNATIALFQNEQSNGSNSSVKSFTNTNLPVIQMHQYLADSLVAAGY